MSYFPLWCGKCYRFADCTHAFASKDKEWTVDEEAELICDYKNKEKMPRSHAEYARRFNCTEKQVANKITRLRSDKDLKIPNRTERKVLNKAIKKHAREEAVAACEQALPAACQQRELAASYAAHVTHAPAPAPTSKKEKRD